MNTNILMEITDYTVPIEQISDKLSFGGMVLLIGMMAVFAVLGIIFIALKIFGLVFGNARTKAPKVKEAVMPKTQVVETPAQSSQDEIAAVIAAAIAMAESESNGMKFKVVSFKRVK